MQRLALLGQGLGEGRWKGVSCQVLCKYGCRNPHESFAVHQLAIFLWDFQRTNR